MLKNLKKTMIARLPVSLQPGKHKSVRYSGFEQKDMSGFDEFVARQVNNPAKNKALELLSEDELLAGKFSMIDIGCGPGSVAQIIMNSEALVNRITYTGVDVSANAINYVQGKIPPHFDARQSDVLANGIPEGDFDVIMINEMLEHIPTYEGLVAEAIARKPKVLAITTFAVLFNRKRDRRLWNQKFQCYMNSYAMEKFYNFLRSRMDCPIMIHDYESLVENRMWFPRKQLLLWYMRPAQTYTGFLAAKK